MLEESASLIAEKVIAIIQNKKWETIVFHAILLENSFQFDIYYKFTGKDSFAKDTELVDGGIIQRNELIRCYFDMRRIIRESLPGNDKNPVTGFTMTIRSTGKFLIDYEYGEQDLICSDEWKRHYLVS